jgi:hypothetical protein
MGDRYITRDHHHKLLGDSVEVVDTSTRIVQSVYTGPYAEQRAEGRARELNAQERRAHDDR